MYYFDNDYLFLDFNSSINSFASLFERLHIEYLAHGVFGL
jgi:hypothetical protein